MLRQRLLTAALLIPLLIWANYALASRHFALLIALITLLGAWEWARLAGFTRLFQRLGYVLLTAAVLWGAVQLPLQLLLWIALVWWTIALLWVLRFPRDERIWSRRAVAVIAGMLVLAPAWRSLSALHEDYGPSVLLFLLSMIWLADSAAYFAGRRWGRRKLAPLVSPGKTWEGVYGALAATLCAALIGGGIARLDTDAYALFVLLCLLTVAISIVGDLFKSMYKRHAKVKDSGGLLPGHGGVLDRIDSLTSATPVFVLGLIVMERWLP